MDIEIGGKAVGTIVFELFKILSHAQLKISDNSAQEKLAGLRSAAKCFTFKEVLSTESSMGLWHKVVTLLKVMGLVESLSMVKNSLMRTSKLATQRNTCYQVRMLAETQTEVSFSLLSRRLLGSTENMLSLVVLNVARRLLS